MNSSSSPAERDRFADVPAIMVNDLDDAIATLESWRDDPAGQVYAARKKLKRLRAAARLFRPIAKKPSRRAGRLFRDAARALSAARDAEVVAATAEHVAERAKTPAASAALQAFAKSRDAGRVPRQADIDEALALMRQARLEVSALPRPDAQVVARALNSMDDRAARAFAGALKSKSSDDLHEWRKKLKNRWHASRILGQDDPKVDAAQARRIRLATRALGDDRDLLLLAEALDVDPQACGGAKAARAARAAVAARRTPLQRKALRLGAELHG